MNKNYECLLCGENLKENKKGIMTNKNTGEVCKCYFCKDCEQSFSVIKDKVQLIPFRDDMTPINHECIICGDIEHFDQKVCFVFNGTAKYSILCIDCAIEFYRNWLRRNDGTNIENITKDNLEEISNLHETICINKLLENPKYIDVLKKSFNKILEEDK